MLQLDFGKDAWYALGMLKRLLKTLLPPSAMAAYHRAMAHAAALRYGNPSRKMVVIGVTGTNGKTTTCNMIARVLEGAGLIVGMATTANFRIAGKERLNDTKMTMLGRFRLQKLLADMVAAGCTHAVVETSSEGIAQFRSAGIAYDAAVLTNLTPEHLESHGGFDNYKAAKQKLFASLAASPRKRVAGKDVPKCIVVNLDSPHAADFLKFSANKKYGFAVERPAGSPAAAGSREVEWPIAIVKALGTDLGDGTVRFTVRDVPFALRMGGLINAENAMGAIATGLALGLELPPMAAALSALGGVPGRQERIDEGQDFTAIVDYSHEPESFVRLYDALKPLPRNRVIHVIGSAGGGRDKARRRILGELAAQYADLVVVTDEDPYDENPAVIMQAVADGARAKGKKEGTDLFVVPDRRAGLAKAVALAGPGDLVLATGKGAEQWICRANGEKEPWDERTELRNAIRNRTRA